MDKTISEQIKKLLSSALPHLQAIYLFGSVAQGTSHQDSDIDVAILDQGLISVEACWDLAQKLAIKLKSDVDLIDLRQTTTVMQKEIVAKGQRILCQDVAAVEKFEDFVFSSYARLNEERSEILENIRERGSVYD